MAIEHGTGDDELRERAINRLKKRHDFYGHLLIFLLVNGFLVLIWAMTSDGGFFWPVFPIVGWGIGVVMNAWDAFGHDGFDEAAIQREVGRLQRQR
jgi:hypothetical protein